MGSKGRGSNMLSIIRACACGELDATVAGVIVPQPLTEAQKGADEHNISTAVISTSDSATLLSQLEIWRTDWICLAGLMKKLPIEVLHRYPGRVLNIHPSLLPKFGGKGMYGHHVHEAVIAAHEPESGCTVHVVTENYDEGPIVLQLRCPVESGDSPDTLAARVLELEHRAYPLAIKKVINEGS